MAQNTLYGYGQAEQSNTYVNSFKCSGNYM